MKILFVGDIVGRPGRNAVKALLSNVMQTNKVDFVVANGENMAAGMGMTIEKYHEMINAGIDYFTSGNHIWAKKEFWPYLDDNQVRVIRPANVDPTWAGRGSAIIDHNGVKIQLINLTGRAFMKIDASDYFAMADELINPSADICIVDFHAEATSEKAILGWYLDGRVTAVLGTHTHIETADERILPKGTAFQTDVGMVGPINSSLGAKYEPFYEAMRNGTIPKYEVAGGEVVFNATLIELDENFKPTSISRIRKTHEPH